MVKYQKYAEYKDSGVEWFSNLPIAWRVGKLKQIVDQNRQITYGIVQAGPNIENGVPYIRPADMSDEKGIKNFDELLRTSESIAYSYDRSKIKSGDIICSIGPSFGKVMITPAVLDGANLTQGTARIAISSENNPRYFFWSLRSTISFSQWESVVGGATFRALNLGPLADTYIALPSFDEQEKIANFLDHETTKIDTLIAKQEKLIELLKEKRQAVISHAITKGLNPNVPMKDSSVEWLGKVPEHWSVTKLAYRYEVLLGKMLDESRITGNYLGKYLRNTDVQWGRINTENLPEMDFRPHEVERYSVKQGDLLVCEGGEIGRCAIWESEEACFYQKALHRLRAYSNQDNHKFMFYVLFDSVHRERFISGAAKATIAHLPAETFKQYCFAFPPKIEQAQIVEYLDTMSKIFDEIEKKALAQIELLKERRTALISAAVTGKIDVRHWQNPHNNNNQDNMELSA